MDDKEFNKWVAKTIPAQFPMSQTDMYLLKAAWIESARREREECKRIAADIAINKQGTAGDVLWVLGRMEGE